MYEIKTVLHVKDLLRRFGIVIYMGDPVSDYEMWEEELRELYAEKLIQPEEFRDAMTVIKQAKYAYQKGR
ncbi:YqgQ family protein [Aneurinibacillus terranovensis]|uniref:YqgQ family protein n=1 Tax=Aneurinibacillus terranovensis TaxID=278991 RepID=UPI00041D71B7|nr:YqgQ family protein [Aneurinibacillus terranovensis]